MTADTLRDRVAELMRRPGYRVLLAQVRDRLEAHGDPAQLTLRGLDAEARDALADLLGRRRRPAAITTVRVEDLDASLRASRVAAGLVEVLEAAGGPLQDHRAASRARRAAWKQVHDDLAVRIDGYDELCRWVDALRADGLLRRLAEDVDTARTLGHQAVDILQHLPADNVPLGVLAADVTGDPHALDAGTALATLVLRGAATLLGQSGLPTGARERRELWAAVGVVCDPLSATVLVLGLRARGTHLLAGALMDHAGFGEPLRLTLRQLVDEALPYEPAIVSVCENPTVMVAAADALAEDCAPLVCADGVPDAAADRLFRDLRAAGCDLRFHTDFDGGGIRIGNLLHDRFGAQPWRMGADDYRAALARVARTPDLAGAVPDARWDDGLAPAMRQAERVVSEEQVLDTLLADLAYPA